MPIVLNMIVKNEAHCIRKCLDSLVGFIDGAVIVDTGSTDGTQDIIAEWMDTNNIDGRILQRPWVNFSHNRNEALDAARQYIKTADDGFDNNVPYIFFIDADEHIDRASLDWRNPTVADGYFLNVNFAGTKYQRMALVRADRPWKWNGVVHEYIDMPDGKLSSMVAPTIIVEHAGARSRDPDTYKKDAELLLSAVTENPSDTRSVFYLAQSYRDAGVLDLAEKYYEQRTSMGGWSQEVFWSWYQVGLIRERLGDCVEDIMSAYLAAVKTDPSRAEAFVALSRVCRKDGNFGAALAFARSAVKLKVNPQALFVDTSAYLWAGHDEVAISAYYCGAFEEGEAAARAALEYRPNDLRFIANLEHYTALKK